jgi:hypothetical protein
VASPPPEEPAGDVRQLPLAKVHDLPATTVPKDKYDLLVNALTEAQDDNAIQRKTLRSINAQLTAARTELKLLKAEAAPDEDVQAVLDAWKEGRPNLKESTFAKGESRWNVTAVAVKKHGKDFCLLVVEGVRRFPYQHYDRHLPIMVPGAKKRDGLAYIFRDGDRMEMLAGLADQDPDQHARQLQQPTTPKATSGGLVPWLTVWRDNRTRIIRYLERRYGPGLPEDPLLGGAAWPCPKCDDPGAPSLRVLGDRNAGGVIARCAICGLDDFRMILAFAKRARDNTTPTTTVRLPP